MMQKKKILLITPMLHQGGFERICAMTARLLSDMYEVHIAVFTSADMFYDVSGIDLIDLELPAKDGKLSKIANIIKRAAKLRALKKNLGIDISYSFGTTANIANVLSKTNDKTWVGIRGYGAMNDSGMGMICCFADLVVCCTKTMERDINDRFSPKKIATLYNPCDVEKIEKLADDESDVKADALNFVKAHSSIIASMGREDDLKGFWHLIKSFSFIKGAHPEFGLMIIGDGSYLEYKKLVEDLGVTNDVFFTGACKNPFALLKYADLYALTSVTEGFPNSLVEAMACGIPCVSVNCKTGPSEILIESDAKDGAEYGVLTDQFNGGKNLDAEIITEEEKRFAEVMAELLSDRERLCKYSQKGRSRAKDFSVDAYVRNIEGLIN